LLKGDYDNDIDDDYDYDYDYDNEYDYDRRQASLRVGAMNELNLMQYV